MKQADRIRLYAREKYVDLARARCEKQFSIRTGDVVREMELGFRTTPAVCSALKTREFLADNGLRLASMTGPASKMTTTVTYTYEFVGEEKDKKTSGGQAAWEKLRGALKDVFAEYGGGEAYLRAERAFFRDADEHK